MTNKQDTVNVYNSRSKELAEKFAGIGARTDDIDYVFGLVEKKDPFVLEIGCGDGRDAAEIVPYSKNYLGIDISEGMLTIARDRLPGTAFEIADIETYEFPDRIDIIFAFASLLHVPKVAFKHILKRAHEAMNPGGAFFISIKQRDSYESDVKRDEFGERLFYFYAPEDILEMNRGLFEVVKMGSEDLLGSTWLEVTLRKT